MSVLFRGSIWSIIVVVAVIFFVLFILYKTLHHQEPDWVTAIVEKGEVNEIVSVSGFVEAKNTAELAFPASGKVTEVFATEGQQVVQGEVLATLASSQLVAERNNATAQLHIAQAQYDKLVAGESSEVKTTADTNVRNAEQNLARTISEENEKVRNARKTLLSDGLASLAVNANEDAVAPYITGSYSCENEGVYTVSVYSSGSASGYSYRFEGLESGTAQVSVDQPSAIGSCGLYLQFDAESSYGNSKWTITIPNTRSAEYIQNANAYALAVEQQTNAVAKAEDARILARTQNAEVYAGPRSEEIREAQASVDGAHARIAEIDAQIDDRSVVAPFEGVVTEVAILKGETAPQTPVITVLASDAFELKTRIPEIDINKVQPGQKTETIFDAQSTEKYLGHISYVSPLATKIDGVAYFEATIVLDATPTWIKSGLNADVSIIVNKRENVLRIPKRFIVENGDASHSVFIADGTEKVATPISVLTFGNDGFAEIEGLEEGQTVVAP